MQRGKGLVSKRRGRKWGGGCKTGEGARVNNMYFQQRAMLITSTAEEVVVGVIESGFGDDFI